MNVSGMKGTKTMDDFQIPATIDVPNSIQYIIDNVIKQDEGGYVLSSDRDGGDGGWTFAGVTKHTWDAVFKTNTSKAQMEKAIADKNIFPSVCHNVQFVYYKNYWMKYWVGIIPFRMQQMYFSACVNMGNNAVEVLQSTINCNLPVTKRIKVDGDFGEQTKTAFIDAYKTCIQPWEFEKLFCWEWLKKYGSIVHQNPTKAQFMNGWFNRVDNYWQQVWR